jgi:hypothetical protein
MEFDIKELTITLMVGAFTILGFEAILAYCFGKEIIGIFKRKTGPAAANDHPFVTIVLLAVFAFGLGVIAENLSLKYVDSDDFPFKKIPAGILDLVDHRIVPKLGLPSVDDDRAIALVGNFKAPRPNSLARDLAIHHAFLIDDPWGTGGRVERWFSVLDNEDRCDPLNPKQYNENPENKKKDDCASKEEIETSAQALYYYAKNTAYSHPQNYDELKRLEDRLQFVRSVSFVAFLYSLTVALLILTDIVVSFIRKSTQKRRNGLRRRGKLFDSQTMAIGARQLKPLAVLAVMLGVYFFSIWAYGRESEAFNRRAFGHLSTRLISEQHHPVEKGDDSVTPKFKFAETVK